MLTISYEIDDFFNIPKLDGEECSIMISSDDGSSRDIIYDILDNIFAKNDLIFKASGYPNNIDELITFLEDTPYSYFEGDRKKFYFKRYTEVFSRITDPNIIRKIVEKWECTACERRYLYVLKNNQVDNMCNLLSSTVYQDTNNIIRAWEYLDCLIENAGDNQYHDTFVLTFRNQYAPQMNQVLTVL